MEANGRRVESGSEGVGDVRVMRGEEGRWGDGEGEAGRSVVGDKAADCLVGVAGGPESDSWTKEVGGDAVREVSSSRGRGP